MIKYLLYIYAFTIGYGLSSYNQLKNRCGARWTTKDYFIYAIEFIIVSPFLVLIDLYYWILSILQK